MFIQTIGPLAACLLNEYVLYIFFGGNLGAPGARGPGARVHRRTGRGVRGGGQLTPQFGQIYDIYSGKRQHICLTNCVTPNGTSIHLPEIHFGWGNKGDVHRV